MRTLATSRSTLDDLLPVGSEVTLENCHREPIGTPGGIQPHGALLAVRTADGIIVQRSVNALGRLGVGDEVLGRPIADLLGAHGADALLGAASGAPAGLRPITVVAGDRVFDAVAYSEGPQLTLVELEPASPAASAAALAEDLASMLAALQSATTPETLLARATAWVRELTGFDRVWVYRFEADDHGVVIAEERAPELEPFLGLHFPARDIPLQARALFLTNRIRFIPDSHAEPSPLLPLVNPVIDAWPDLSPGILRAVSPMHLQYLRNMGTRASMSIAIEVEGRLWGLISGHHYAGARVVEHRLRLACELLGRVVSTQLSSLLARDAATRGREIDRHREAILEVLAKGDVQVGALTAAGADLLALCRADGAAICVADEVGLIGATPAAAAVRALVDGVGDAVWVSEAVGEDRPELADDLGGLAGALILPLGQGGPAQIVWFRHEYRHTVTWGDNGLAPARDRLSPSGSYGTWSESVTGHSRPWSAEDRAAVESLRAGIGAAVLTQAERLARANTELARSNADLRAFTFIIAHDLREPLRNLQSFLGFFVEDHGAEVAPDGLEQLGTVRRLADRMDGLMNSLLEHAKADRRTPSLEPLALGEVLESTLVLLPPEPARAEVDLLAPDVRLLADRDALTHILINLITNAAKYSPGEAPRVEIDVQPLGLTSHAGTRAPAEGWLAVGVRDFGIGIEAEHTEAIFELFRRLHARDAYGGGSGAGLAIARRLAERQGGELWLERSVPGEGSLFCFSVRTA